MILIPKKYSGSSWIRRSTNRRQKVKVVKEWKKSTKIKEVKSFLEFVNFYRHFIKNFSYIAKLLNKLKNKKEWK